MPKVKIETVIDVWCKKCGNGLCNQSHGRRAPNIIDVEPCKVCLEKAKQAGIEEAKEQWRQIRP